MLSRGREEREGLTWEELRILEMIGSHVIMVLSGMKDVENEGCRELEKGRRPNKLHRFGLLRTLKFFERLTKMLTKSVGFI